MNPCFHPSMDHHQVLLHQFCACHSGSDGGNTMLRSSISPEQALWPSLRIAWTWRKRRRGTMRMIPVFAIALVSMICWILAGLLTSSIQSASGNEVLGSVQVCGHANLKSTPRGPGPCIGHSGFSPRRNMANDMILTIPRAYVLEIGVLESRGA